MKTKDQYILYSLPFLILFLIYLNKDYFLTKSDLGMDKNLQEYKIKIQEKFRREKVSNIELISFYEKVAKDMRVKIEKINFENNRLHLLSKGKLHNSMEFLYHIEQISTIQKFEFKFESNQLYINFFIDIKDIDLNITASNEKRKIVNPYITLNKEELDTDNFTVAVFDQYIFYKGKWIGIGEKYKGREIINITHNMLELKGDDGMVYKEKINEE